MNEPTCEACGRRLDDHLGLTGTCADLQRAIRLIQRIRDIHAEDQPQPPKHEVFFSLDSFLYSLKNRR